MYERPDQALPLAGYSLFETGDVDEAREQVGRVFSDHSLAPVRGRVSLDAHHNRVDLGGLSVNYLHYGATVTIDPGELGSYYLLQLPLAGSAQVACGDREIIADPGRGSLLNATGRVRMCWSGDCRKLLVQVDRDTMIDYLRALTGRELRSPPCFELAVPLAGGPGRLLRDTVGFVVERLETLRDAAGNPLVAAQLRQMLLGTLVHAQAGEASGLLARAETEPCPRYVRRAEEYIEAHADESLTLESIARACCISGRALQQGFRRHRGTTPMAFVREVRLRRVREALLAADPGETVRVGEVALRWGFGHFGRFCQYYRQRFGETPTQTLARG
ncbi:AraC family transcriptional regulator [Arhodomonas sp. SL1]|uniref:AraC family transcriptional regulator n=1 Tax=Arhodomonas sp. SL1 TaxID=3425691 RepID=UPI003F881256